MKDLLISYHTGSNPVLTTIKKPLHNRFIFPFGARATGLSVAVKLNHMSTYPFVELNQQSILNIDGCLTETANITIQQADGRLAFYYFEGGE